MNPFLIILNIGNYLGSWKIRSQGQSPGKTAVDWKLILPLVIIGLTFLAGLFDPSAFDVVPFSSDPYPTQNIVSAPTLDRQPASSPFILYSDDFSSTSSGWPSEVTASGSSKYFDGKYSVSSKKGNQYIWAETEAFYADGILKIEFITSDSVLASDTTQALFWRLKDKDNFYLLEISGNGCLTISK